MGCGASTDDDGTPQSGGLPGSPKLQAPAANAKPVKIGVENPLPNPNRRKGYLTQQADSLEDYKELLRANGIAVAADEDLAAPLDTSQIVVVSRTNSDVGSLRSSLRKGASFRSASTPGGSPRIRKRRGSAFASASASASASSFRMAPEPSSVSNEALIQHLVSQSISLNSTAGPGSGGNRSAPSFGPMESSASCCSRAAGRRPADGGGGAVSLLHEFSESDLVPAYKRQSPPKGSPPPPAAAEDDATKAGASGPQPHPNALPLYESSPLLVTTAPTGAAAAVGAEATATSCTSPSACDVSGGPHQQSSGSAHGRAADDDFGSDEDDYAEEPTTVRAGDIRRKSVAFVERVAIIEAPAPQSKYPQYF